MDSATLSLGALFIAIIVGCTIRLHVGFLAISLAWIVGVYIDDMSAREVMAGFPTRLFLTLAGVTLLFSQAQANGTGRSISLRTRRSACAREGQRRRPSRRRLGVVDARSALHGGGSKAGG